MVSKHTGSVILVINVYDYIRIIAYKINYKVKRIFTIYDKVSVAYCDLKLFEYY
jgi:hypothetical protein